MEINDRVKQFIWKITIFFVSRYCLNYFSLVWYQAAILYGNLLRLSDNQTLFNREPQKLLHFGQAKEITATTLINQIHTQYFYNRKATNQENIIQFSWDENNNVVQIFELVMWPSAARIQTGG